jgi:hypothetical protein
VDPTCTPRSTPNGDVTLRNLIERVGFKDWQNLDDRGPKSPLRNIWIWAPNGGIRKILGF